MLKRTTGRNHGVRNRDTRSKAKETGKTREAEKLPFVEG